MALFIIDSLDKLKQKMDLVSSLIDIKTALKMKGRKTRAASKTKTQKVEMEETNPIDDQYEKLNCKIKSVSSTSKEYKMIDTYIQNTSNYYKL